MEIRGKTAVIVGGLVGATLGLTLARGMILLAPLVVTVPKAIADGVALDWRVLTFVMSMSLVGSLRVLHGAMSYLLQDKDGQVIETRSISAGLDYPGVGPEHSFYKDSGRAEYVAVTDRQALEGLTLLCETEGIIPALESAHAIFYAAEVARKLPKDQIVLINVSGRGDKDTEIVAEALAKLSGS